MDFAEQILFLKAINDVPCRNASGLQKDCKKCSRETLKITTLLSTSNPLHLQLSSLAVLEAPTIRERAPNFHGQKAISEFL